MYREISGLLNFPAVRGRGGKNHFWLWQISSQHFDFLLWRAVGGEGNIYSGKITLTSAGPLRENQQKPPERREGGREENPQGRAVPKHTGKVEPRGSYTAYQLIQGTPLRWASNLLLLHTHIQRFSFSPWNLLLRLPRSYHKPWTGPSPPGADPAPPPHHCLALGPLQFHSRGLDRLHLRATPQRKCKT